MKITLLLTLLFLSAIAHAKCPSGIYSDENEDPFYNFKANEKKNITLIFCGYPGDSNKESIKTGEYDIFLIDATGSILNGKEPILAFGAVDDTVIYKSKSKLVIKDIWGGFTYTFDKKNLKFKKIFSYKPSAISQTKFNELLKKIHAGEMDYTWPWMVLDATIIGYPEAEQTLLNLPNLDGAAAEEYDKVMKVYDAYKKNSKRRAEK